MYIDYADDQPGIRYSVVLNNELNILLTVDGIPVKANELTHILVPCNTILKTRDQLYSIINYKQV